MKKNVLIKSLSVLLVAALTVITVFLCFLAGCTITKSEAEESIIPNGINIDSITESSVVKINAVSSSQFVKTITATITGDIKDKTVKWNIVWADEASHSSESVNTYVTISSDTTTSGQALTVTCIKGFGSDKIILTASPSISGYSATCVISYDGAPSVINIDYGSNSLQHDSNWGLNMLELNIGETYSFNFSIDNDLHDVGEKYKNSSNFEIKYEVFGILLGNKRSVYPPANKDDIVSSNVEIGFKIYDVKGENYGYPVIYSNETKGDGTSDGCLQFINPVLKADLSGYTIKINPLLSIANGVRYSSTVSSRGAHPYYEITGYKDNKCPYVKITITEKISCVSTSINVKNLTPISGFSLNQSTITF